MSRVFADTHFYLAILNDRDSGHGRAHDFSEIVTTAGVWLEIADGMAKVRSRERCARFVQYLRAAEATKVIPLTDGLIERGLALTAALTGDRHFEQAGFVPLLA